MLRLSGDREIRLHPEELGTLVSRASPGTPGGSSSCRTMPCTGTEPPGT
jgi:hypothetical protein